MSNFYHELVSRINSHRRIPPTVTDLYQKVKKLIPKNPVIVEAGAHMGYDTYGLAKIWSKGMVYAFEPIPYVYDNLVERLKKVSNVRTYNLALGQMNGVVEMHVSSGGSTASSSVLKPSVHLAKFPSVTFRSKIEVPVKRIADWAKEEKVSKIDLLWLDMQGYEVNALQGSGNLIQSVSVIYTELCKSELYVGLVTQGEYIDFLKKLGFELIYLTGDGEVNDGIFLNTKASMDKQ